MVEALSFGVDYFGVGDNTSNVSHLAVDTPLYKGLTCYSIFVGYPKMAQKGIDDSRLVLISQKITNPTADALNLALTSVLLSDSSNHPQLDAFDGSFYLAGSDTPFATVLVPGFQAINGSVAQITQHLQISNMSSLIGYTQSTLQNRSLTVYLRGKGGLKQGSLPKINVNYNQRIDLVGMLGSGLDIRMFY